MKVKSVPSRWIYEEGLRLDCGPYMSGAVEARKILEGLKLPKQELSELTIGHNGGIYNGPMFRRNYVESDEYGVPFMTSGSILLADLSNLPLLRKKDALSKKLSYLKLAEGMTLISCSGTIGRMTYTRSDMEGMWSSQDVLKVVPNKEKILPGYLFTYLSSKFGLPQIISGTYGAIIQHLEPHHIAYLTVPRLNHVLEEKIHNLIQQASKLRVDASNIFMDVEYKLTKELDIPSFSLDDEEKELYNEIPSSKILRTLRLEGFYYNRTAQNVDSWAESHSNGCWYLEEVANVFDVPPFKHIYVEPEEGVPFFTSGDLFKLDREVDKYLSRTQTKNLEKYILEKGWVLLARSGQLGGIIGRPQFSDSAMEGAATSDHVIRIVPNIKQIEPGYLYAYLSSSKIGYPLITRTMTGASIPALWPVYLNKIKIVKATPSFMKDIDGLVKSAFEKRVQATQIEQSARDFLEKAIEEAA